MRFKLNDPADMQLIYEYSVKVYNKLIKQADAVSELLARTGATEASIGMYFDIYSCMRQGKVYKSGTSEEYTKFLLASIFRDEGKPGLEKALAAVKSNAEYFEQKGKSPDRLVRACQEVIKECGVSIPFEYKRQSVSHSGVIVDKTRPQEISAEDMVTLKDCDRSPNKQFASTIMHFLEKYQILSDAGINIATDPERCKEMFDSSYPMLLEVDPRRTLSDQIHDRSGKTRFYSSEYTLNGRKFLMTSELYGLGSSQGRQNNRAAFHAWILSKAESIAIDTDEITMKGGEKEMTIKEKVAAIKAYIAARGFNYEGDLIENFYLSLKSKPFVILAGTSGTGKTRLVKLFAEAIGAQMKLVPVRPDWSDSSDLFGHTDLSNEFHAGAIIEFIKQAEQNEKTPHFICLDEMNLARVEYYLSDILSIIETRDRRANGRIETDPLLDETYFKKDADKKKYGRVFLPDNLYIIGTVNMDETTFPFSKKVLDRANTIEFSFVDLMSRPAKGGVATALQLDNSFLRTDYLYLQDCDDEDLIEGVCLNLGELNDILVKANLHVGYRVRDEIAFYMMNNKKADLLTEEAALDHEIMQKILPRVQGSSGAIKEVLSELFKVCAGDYTGFNGSAAYEQMDSYLDSKSCKYPNSAKKIAFMMRRYEEDGFTSYWL